MSKKRPKRLQTPKSKRYSKPARKGQHYRSEKYIPYIFKAEIGIYESSMMVPELTDAQVLRAVRTMIKQLRAGKTSDLADGSGGTDNLIAWRISENLKQLPRLSSADMTGCLNEVLKSAQTRSEMHRGPRGYLKYLEGFMRQAGVEVQMLPVDEFDELFEEGEVDFGAMSLAEIGDLWLQDPQLWDVDLAFENRASEMSRQGQAQEVIATCKRLLKRTQDPNIQADLYHVAGEAYYQLGDYEQAAAMQGAALKEHPDFLGALDAIARAYRALEQPQEAIEAWEKELRLAPGNVHCYRDIAETYRALGDLDSEEATLRRWLTRQPPPTGLMGRLASRLADLEARNTTVMVRLADCLRRQGRTEEAEKVDERLKRAMPEMEAGVEDWAHWTRYQLQDERGERALTALEKVERLALGPVHWELAVQAAVLDVMGRREEAAQRWKRVAGLVAGKPWGWPLTTTRDILGDLLPADSELFKYIEPEI